MPQALASWFDWLQQHAELFTLISVSLLLLSAWLSNWLIKRILVRALCRLLDSTALGRNAQNLDNQLIQRLANVVPALLISAGVGLIPDLPESLVSVTRNVCNAFIVLTVALALSLVLDIANTLYNLRPDAHLRPVKGYLQVLKISVFAVAAILMIASLIDRSPLILLSGLGAMAAVLMLIFQDTLLSLVASVQITSSDIIRVGDWVEMPQLNADGDVIDIPCIRSRCRTGIKPSPASRLDALSPTRSRTGAACRNVAVEGSCAACTWTKPASAFSTPTRLLTCNTSTCSANTYNTSTVNWVAGTVR